MDLYNLVEETRTAPAARSIKSFCNLFNACTALTCSRGPKNLQAAFPGLLEILFGSREMQGVADMCTGEQDVILLVRTLAPESKFFNMLMAYTATTSFKSVGMAGRPFAEHFIEGFLESVGLFYLKHKPAARRTPGTNGLQTTTPFVLAYTDALLAFFLPDKEPLRMKTAQEGTKIQLGTSAVYAEFLVERAAVHWLDDKCLALFDIQLAFTSHIARLGAVVLREASGCLQNAAVLLIAGRAETKARRNLFRWLAALLQNTPAFSDEERRLCGVWLQYAFPLPHTPPTRDFVLSRFPIYHHLFYLFLEKQTGAMKMLVATKINNLVRTQLELFCRETNEIFALFTKIKPQLALGSSLLGQGSRGRLPEERCLERGLECFLGKNNGKHLLGILGASWGVQELKKSFATLLLWLKATLLASDSQLGETRKHKLLLEQISRLLEQTKNLFDLPEEKLQKEASGIWKRAVEKETSGGVQKRTLKPTREPLQLHPQQKLPTSYESRALLAGTAYLDLFLNKIAQGVLAALHRRTGLDVFLSIQRYRLCTRFLASYVFLTWTAAFFICWKLYCSLA